MSIHRKASGLTADHWIAEFFAAKSALTGGVIRRSRREVDATIGLDRLEMEVRRRDFHLLVCGSQYLVVCEPGEIRAIC